MNQRPGDDAADDAVSVELHARCLAEPQKERDGVREKRGESFASPLPHIVCIYTCCTAVDVLSLSDSLEEGDDL